MNHPKIRPNKRALPSLNGGLIRKNNPDKIEQFRRKLNEERSFMRPGALQPSTKPFPRLHQISDMSGPNHNSFNARRKVNSRSFHSRKNSNPTASRGRKRAAGGLKDRSLDGKYNCK